MMLCGYFPPVTKQVQPDKTAMCFSMRQPTHLHGQLGPSSYWSHWLRADEDHGRAHWAL